MEAYLPAPDRYSSGSFGPYANAMLMFRGGPLHGRRGSYDWLPALPLDEVVLELHHTLRMHGQCLSTALSPSLSLALYRYLSLIVADYLSA